jgi:uncharacterized protein YaiE (UPF0345 family)
MEIKLNVYLEGKVKSLGAECEGQRFTAGVMLPGEYNFGTDQEETITVTIGNLKIKLPNSNWKKVAKGETVVIPAGVKFDLKMEKTCSYICFYGN